MEEAGSPPRFKSKRAEKAAGVFSEDAILGQGLKWSLIVHAGIFIFAVLKSLIFGGPATPYIPTLRVDLVGLPDLLKKDISKLTAPTTDQPESTAAKAPEKTKKIEKAEKDEMVVKPKSEKEDRTKKNQRSLDRIKALAKIQEEDDKPKKTSQIKGNMLSKGSSLSGDARESGEPSYLDTVRDRLQSNWELNPYLARQKLSAQVRINIDSSGQLRSFQFVRNSGNAAFDSAVKKTIQASSPFPRPPRAILSSLLLDGVLVGFPL